MEGLTTVPVVTLVAIRRVRSFPGGSHLSREADALVWDPTAVRALLDEKVYRNPMVALLVSGTRKFE